MRLLHFFFVYLDDMLIFSKNEEEHAEHLRQELAILRENKLHARLEKCKFYQNPLSFWDISSLTMAIDLPQTSSLLSEGGQPRKT